LMGSEPNVPIGYFPMKGVLRKSLLGGEKKYGKAQLIPFLNKESKGRYPIPLYYRKAPERATKRPIRSKEEVPS